jgi:hypothetical protein
MSMEEEDKPIHCSKKGGVKNLTFENMFKAPKPGGWLCSKCNGAKMYLHPISLDEPAQFWKCSKCERQITIEERNQVFEAIRQNVKDQYLLHVFDYDKGWEIKSSEWIGESRIGAKRKPITPSERADYRYTTHNT